MVHEIILRLSCEDLLSRGPELAANLGYSSDGILEGSPAARGMSIEAIANGGVVPSVDMWGLTASLQSIGARGYVTAEVHRAMLIALKVYPSEEFGRVDEEKLSSQRRESERKEAMRELNCIKQGMRDMMEAFAEEGQKDERRVATGEEETQRVKGPVCRIQKETEDKMYYSSGINWNDKNNGEVPALVDFVDTKSFCRLQSFDTARTDNTTAVEQYQEDEDSIAETSSISSRHSWRKSNSPRFGTRIIGRFRTLRMTAKKLDRERFQNRRERRNRRMQEAHDATAAQ